MLRAISRIVNQLNFEVNWFVYIHGTKVTVDNSPLNGFHERALQTYIHGEIFVK